MIFIDFVCMLYYLLCKNKLNSFDKVYLIYFVIFLYDFLLVVFKIDRFKLFVFDWSWLLYVLIYYIYCLIDVNIFFFILILKKDLKNN